MDDRAWFGTARDLTASDGPRTDGWAAQAPVVAESWGRPAAPQVSTPPRPQRLLNALLLILLAAAARIVAVGAMAATDRGTATDSPVGPGAASGAAAPTSTPSSAVVRAQTPALLELAALQVGEPSTATYDPASFGPTWTDVDRNGCGTRNDVLRRDLQAAVLKADTLGCAVLSGSLQDPYTGHDLSFVRGDASIGIDHVVALADAWRSSASTWPYEKRLAFANEPLGLQATSAGVNASKSDADASS